MTNNIIFIIYKVIQLTGAIIILINNVSLSRKSVLNIFQNSNLIIKEDNKLKYDEKELRNVYKTIHLNRISFIFILITLFLDGFNITFNMNIFVISIIIIVVSILMCFLLEKLVSLIVNESYIKRITEKELTSFNMKPDIDTYSKEEIDAMMNEK